MRKANNITSMNNDYARLHEKRKKNATKHKRRLVRRLTVFFTIVIMVGVGLISILFSGSDRLESKEAEHTQLKKELQSLQDEQLLLEEELAKLNDDEYIAKLARKEYFLSDEGEIIFTLPKSE
ncbi:septum formation initiator family protein [Bacillus spongiae]|uniref:Septum formation initiator family protein n=1 Tax=Bacillus spongiae TaxID=2683610 RepID=A0ABU8HJE1_9BACI